MRVTVWVKHPLLLAADGVGLVPWTKPQPVVRGSEWCIACVRHFEWLIVLICRFCVCLICTPPPKKKRNTHLFPTRQYDFPTKHLTCATFSRGDIPQGAQFDGCCLNGFEAGSDTPNFWRGRCLSGKKKWKSLRWVFTYLELVSSFF